MTYSIGEMAEMLGLPASTLRYYDKQGLLPFVDRTRGGIRVFKDSDYEWLKIIECMKHAGMPLKSIRTYIELALKGNETINERLELFRKQRALLQEQMAAMQRTLDTLDYKCWYYETAETAGTTAVPQNMPLEQVPEQFRAVRAGLKGTV